MPRSASGLGLIVVLLAACSSAAPTPDPGGTPGTAASPSGPAGTGGAGTAAPTTTGEIILPAGAQFDAQETLPATGGWGFAEASADGRTLMAPGRNAGGDFRLAVSVDGGAWEDRPFIEADIPGPGGYAPDKLDNGALRGFVVDIASGLRGTVVVGTREFRSSAGSPTVRSAIWFSSDLATWKRTELASILGGDRAVQVNGVIAVDDGWLVVATVSDVELRTPSSIRLLHSTDGIDWKATGSIDSIFSLSANARIGCAACREPLIAQDGRLLLVGQEYACDTNAGGMFPTRRDGIRRGRQQRLWTSTDSGATWTPVDLSASGLVISPKPAPTTLADCPDLGAAGAAETFNAEVGTRGTFAGFAGNAVVVIDGGRTATSTDLATWVTAEIPDYAPSSDYLTNLQPGPRLLVPLGSGFALVALDPRRTSTGRPSGPDYQSIVWTTLDGSAWSRLEASPAPVVLDQPLSARLWLVGPDLAVLQGGTVFRRSHGGPLIPWTP